MLKTALAALALAATIHRGGDVAAATQRRTFDHNAIVATAGHSPFVASHSGILVRDRRLTVPVRAGQTVLVILDPAPLTTVSDPVFLDLESSVQGLQWWALDSPYPAISPTTRPFGPILDVNAPNFDHVHSKPSGLTVSGGPVDHDITPAKQFHDGIFPTFLSVAEDRAYLGYAENGPVIFEGKTTSPCTIGPVEDLAIKAAVPGGFPRGNQRSMVYAWGLTDYADFGTEEDGLRFYLVFYIADPATLGTARPLIVLQMYSYPFTVDHVDPAGIPATQDHGETIWAKDDVLLCPRDIFDGVHDCGYMTSQFGASYNWQVGTGGTDPTINDGCMIVQSPAKNVHGVNPGWAQVNASAPAPFAGEGFAWNRVTLLRLGVLAASDAGTPPGETDLRLSNIVFGPQPGRVHDLRPNSYVTDQAWSVDSVPAIGIQNATTRDAEVSVRYGAIRQ